MCIIKLFIFFDFRFPLRKFLLPRTQVCLWMLICFIIQHTWSSMQLIWPGILLSDSLPLLKFLGRGSLLTLLMFLMMRAATSLGVHRGLLSSVLSKGNCYFNLLLILLICSHTLIHTYWRHAIFNIIFCNHADLLKEYNVELKGPFNYSARDKSGIPGDW